MGKLLSSFMAVVLLSGCVSNHRCLSSDKIGVPVNFDRFTRKGELGENPSVSMKPECLAYFKEHPDKKSDSAKVMFFPLVNGKSEVLCKEEQFEWDIKFRWLLGLIHQEAYVAFDANGNPVKVAHINENCMMGLLASFKGELDFSTKTGASQTGYLLNAFGRSVTHSGKKYTYVLWIPFRYE